MSDDFRLPLVLDGSAISVLVVGGGEIGLRKARGFLDAGCRVRVLAVEPHAALTELARRETRLAITTGRYDAGALEDATLVVAATDDRDVNAKVARDARGRGRLVLVVDAPEEGNCITPAVHRAGPLLVAVSASGLPAAAARVRDEIAARFDERYAAAVAELRSLRRELLAAGARGRWREACDELIDDAFCESVERETLAERVASWR